MLNVLKVFKKTQRKHDKFLGSTALSSETGAIMLEVVAVLALMGVMGATLFRQIYQRNQELHNIQMASEIRTVKEAFAAYIQANRATVIEACDDPGNGVEECTPDNMVNGIKEYLPDGWFSEGSVDDAYSFTIWNYYQKDASNRRIVYGVVVPKKETLPTSGWNFKRAARVALLIGADGGAYSTKITGGTINGSLGSWDLEADGIIGGANCVADDVAEDCPTYAAMTGLDIFVPETLVASGEINIPERWSLALQNLHAYNYFSVGEDNDCYAIQHNETYTTAVVDGPSLGDVKSDAITPKGDSCKPLFWVGDDHGENATTGNVYVLNDLNVGADPTNAGNHALKLTAEGVIRQKDGLTIDKDGRIIAKDKVSANIGDLKTGENYVLDPAYTSTMNDIRLASRGGVRLSDILPNYILKNQTEIGGTENQEITKPTCPSGARYKKALAIIPTSWNKKGLTVDVNDIAGKLNSTVSVDTLASNLKVSGTDVVKNGNSTVSVNHNIGASPNDKSTVENDTGLCVMVNGTQKATADENDTWTITLGTRDNSTCNYDSTARAIVQTYCYWAPSVYDNHGAECEAAGYFYDEGNSRCTETHAVDSTMSGSVVGAERSQAACEAAGYTWENNRCKIVLLDSDEIDVKAGMTIHQKAAACQAAGHKWTWTDADKNDGHCTN